MDFTGAWGGFTRGLWDFTRAWGDFTRGLWDFTRARGDFTRAWVDFTRGLAVAWLGGGPRYVLPLRERRLTTKILLLEEEDQDSNG